MSKFKRSNASSRVFVSSGLMRGVERPCALFRRKKATSRLRADGAWRVTIRALVARAEAICAGAAADVRNSRRTWTNCSWSLWPIASNASSSLSVIEWTTASMSVSVMCRAQRSLLTASSSKCSVMYCTSRTRVFRSSRKRAQSTRSAQPRG